MQIKDLEVRQGNVDIEVEVTDKGEVREFQKFGKSGWVCNETVKDETSEVKITLWNEDIDKVSVGDKIKLTNGYVSEFQGEKQVTTGKFGKLEVVGKSEGGAAPVVEEPKPEEPAVEEKPVAPEEPVVSEEKVE